MKTFMRLLFNAFAMTALLFLLCSCVEKDSEKAESTATPPPPPAAEKTAYRTVIEPDLLPNRFRQTGYVISEDTSYASSNAESVALNDLQLKVGANISTKEPIPLRDAMKALVKIKNMSLSWAPDVDQELRVDVDIHANDNFYEAIDNILRQLDYFHEVEGSTIIVKYRETKQYHIAMPFIRQYYDSYTGSQEGSLKNQKWENKFDQWEVIQNNLDKIIATWSTTAVTPQEASGTDTEKKNDAVKKESDKNDTAPVVAVSRRVSSTDSTYTIDKPVGLITVNAPKSLQKRIANYLSNLEHELYKQIIIEAKIIEVQLNDNSSLGINWNTLLNNLTFDGIGYGKSKSYSRDEQENDETSSSTSYSDSKEDISSRSSERTSDSALGAEGTNSQNSSTEDTTESHKIGADSTNSDFAITSSSSNSSSDSSSDSTKRTISNVLSKGASTATLLTTLSSMAEGMSAGVTLYGFNFTSFIKALQEQGKTTILSNPKISVLNGQPALIKVGKDITYISSIETKRAENGGGVDYSVETSTLLSGIGMALTAVVKDNNEIVMNLSPVTSELVGDVIEYETVGEGKIGLPVINKREMNTWVKVKDGSMLVVGGLISEVESKDGNTIIPGTQDIPYLKYLFGYEEKRKAKRELIILLRPRIIN